MAEALKTKVVILIHYDVWSNFKDPAEILKLTTLKTCWITGSNRLFGMWAVSFYILGIRHFRTITARI